MAASSSDRVKKFRAKKCDTPEGHAEVKAKNRLYKARSRRKNDIKRLTTEIMNLHNNGVHHPVQHPWVRDEVMGYRAHLLKRRIGIACGRELTQDEQQELHMDVLKYHIKLMKKTCNKGGEKKKELHRGAIVHSDMMGVGLAAEITSSSLPMAAVAVKDPIEMTHSDWVEATLTGDLLNGLAAQVKDPFEGTRIECVEATHDDLLNVLCALGNEKYY